MLAGATGGTLYGWSDQLASAVDTLRRNARRFCPAGSVVMVRLEATGRDYQVEIRDQGPGVPEEWLSRLGEPFTRVPVQPADSGHGLGLAIARRAVARHGGTLDFSLTDTGGLRARIS